MRKFGVMFIFIFLAACSTAEAGTPASTADTPHASTSISTQTSIPSTDTPAPTIPPTALPTAIGGGGGKIAFTSERDGSSEIYVVNADGSGLSPLANEITPKYDPSWSPDGEKIAFGTNDNDSASLYIMNADGSNPVKLIDTHDISTYDSATSDWRFEVSPIWSPDGTKIAFEVSYYIGCCSSHGYIHLVNADGSGLVGS
ncbi:MAG: PD40 domain-containing protein, partial [Anaerolineales bacterium]|nr:PD40 domain-containing protein [Anaerolineales bacterium]